MRLTLLILYRGVTLSYTGPSPEAGPEVVQGQLYSLALKPTYRVQGGIEALWEREGNRLRAHARKQLKDPTAAEDVVIEAFTQLAAAQEQGRVVEKPGAWLWSAVQGLVVNELRRRERETPVGSLREDSEPEPVRQVKPPSLRESMFAADFDREIRELPWLERASFILTELRGLSCREAAPVLDVSHTTVCENRRAAAAKLRAAL